MRQIFAYPTYCMLHKRNKVSDINKLAAIKMTRLIIIILFLILGSCNTAVNKSDIITVESVTFNSDTWRKEDFKARGTMVDNLLLRKDSLLLNKSPQEINKLLGKPDERTIEDMIYFFEKKYSNDIIILSHLIVRFDTIQNVSIESWWTD